MNLAISLKSTLYVVIVITTFYLKFAECGSEPLTVCLPFPIDEDDILNDSEILNSFVRNNQTEIFLARNTSERYNHEEHIINNNNRNLIGQPRRKSPVYLCKRKPKKAVTEEKSNLESEITDSKQTTPVRRPVYVKKSRSSSNSVVRTSRNTEPVEQVASDVRYEQNRRYNNELAQAEGFRHQGNSKSVTKQPAGEKVLGATILALFLGGIGLLFHVIFTLFGQIFKKPSYSQSYNNGGPYRRNDVGIEEEESKKQKDDELMQKISKGLYNIHFHFGDREKTISSRIAKLDSGQNNSSSTSDDENNTSNMIMSSSSGTNGQEKVMEILKLFLEKLTKPK